MNPLEQHLTGYLKLDYKVIETQSKIVEVGLYKIDESDIKFRVVKFINGVLKEIYTSENKDEAIAKFLKLSKR